MYDVITMPWGLSLQWDLDHAPVRCLHGIQHQGVLRDSTAGLADRVRAEPVVGEARVRRVVRGAVLEQVHVDARCLRQLQVEARKLVEHLLHHVAVLDSTWESQNVCTSASNKTIHGSFSRYSQPNAAARKVSNTIMRVSLQT